MQPFQGPENCSCYITKAIFSTDNSKTIASKTKKGVNLPATKDGTDVKEKNKSKCTSFAKY